MKRWVIAVVVLVLVSVAFGQQAYNVGVTVLSGVGWLNVNTTSSGVAAAALPPEGGVIGGSDYGTGCSGGPCIRYAKVDTNGSVYMNLATTANPCQAPGATILGVGGATSGTAAVQIVPLSGTTKIYICSATVTGVSGTTPTFSLRFGTGTACASTTVNVWGPITTTTLTAYSMPPTPAVSPAGYQLCYLDSGTTPIQNYAITYVQQ